MRSAGSSPAARVYTLPFYLLSAALPLGALASSLHGGENNHTYRPASFGRTCGCVRTCRALRMVPGL